MMIGILILLIVITLFMVAILYKIQKRLERFEDILLEVAGKTTGIYNCTYSLATRTGKSEKKE